MKIRVLLGIEATLFREGLKSILKTDSTFEVVGESAEFAELCRMACHRQSDILLLDARLLEPNKQHGFAVQDVIHACPQLLVIQILHETPHQHQSPQSNAASISMSLSAEAMLLELRRYYAHWKHTRPDISEASHLHSGLTERELTILPLVAEGLCNKEIAARLHLSLQTVKNHISHLLAKLGFVDRTQLAVYALQIGVYGKHEEESREH